MNKYSEMLCRIHEEEVKPQEEEGEQEVRDNSRWSLSSSNELPLSPTELEEKKEKERNEKMMLSVMTYVIIILMTRLEKKSSAMKFLL